MMTGSKSNGRKTEHLSAKMLTYGMIGVLILVVSVMYFLPFRDGDVWFHLLYGKLLLQKNLLIPDHTLFSWTQSSNDIIYCTWLSDWFLYLLYSTGGVFSLFVFRYLCMFLYVYAVVTYARSLNIFHEPKVWLLCLLGVLLSFNAGYCKPEIVSYVCMVLVVWNWWYIRSFPEKTIRNGVFFPLIMLVWVNSHGGVIFGYLFLSVVAAGEVLNMAFSSSTLSRGNRYYLLVILFVSCATFFITPYGYHYPLQLIRGHLLPVGENTQYYSYIGNYVTPLIREAGRLDFVDLAIVLILFFITIFFTAGKEKKTDKTLLLTNLVFALVFSRYQRSTFYWVPVFTFSLMPLLAVKPKLITGVSVHKRRGWALLVVSVFLILSSWRTYDTLYRPIGHDYVGLDVGEFSPVQEAEFILQNYPGQNVGNTYNQGAYLSWALWPDYPVMVDARYFPYRQWIHKYFDLINVPENSSLLLGDECKVWCVGLHQKRLLYWFANSPQWKLVFYGKNAAVYVKNELEASESVVESNPALFSGIQSPHTLDLVFSFSLLNRDWDVATSLVDQLAKMRLPGEKKQWPVAAQRFLDAKQAYFRKEFSEVDVLLSDSTLWSYYQDNLMYATACFKNALAAWKNNNDTRAVEQINKALSIRPNADIYFIHGVMLCYLGQNDMLIQKGGSVESLWQTSLKKFLVLTEGYQDKVKPTRQLATDLLQGKKMKKRPQFISSKAG